MIPCSNLAEEEVVMGVITDHKFNMCQTSGKNYEKEGGLVGTLQSIEKSYTGKSKMVCDGMRSFQSFLQREGLGCSILPTFCFRVHTAAKELLDRIRKVS